MTNLQWEIVCRFMHAMLKDEGNTQFKKLLRHQMGELPASRKYTEEMERMGSSVVGKTDS